MILCINRLFHCSLGKQPSTDLSKTHPFLDFFLFVNLCMFSFSLGFYFVLNKQSIQMPTLPPQVDKFLADFDKKLHEPNAITNLLGTIEAKSGLKRLHVAGVLVFFYMLYLLFGRWAQLACNLTGFLYPAYISIKAIESHQKEDDTQWLTYWVVFALLNVVEFFSNTILYYFPFYWLMKCAMLLWLYLPSTLGAQLLYTRIVRPFHLQNHKNIDGVLNKMGGDARKAFEEHVKET